MFNELYFGGTLRRIAAEMMRETGADYKKAIIAVAIAGGVGATVAGAGLLAFRLWRRRTRNIRETKAGKQSEPAHTVSEYREHSAFDPHGVDK